MANGHTSVTEKKYIDASNFKTTVQEYDFAGRLVKRTNPDGGVTANEYYPNGSLKMTKNPNGGRTYYDYNSFNKVEREWVERDPGKYALTVYGYYKNGLLKTKKQYKQPLSLNASVTGITDFYETIYTYYKNGLLKSETGSDGGKKEYFYDNDGVLSEARSYSDTTNYVKTTYQNNYLGKPDTQKLYANPGEILNANGSANTAVQELTTSFAYDLNGNLKTQTAPNSVATTFYYDDYNRITGTTMPDADENGSSATLGFSDMTAYDWAGRKTSEKDPNGNVTTFGYNKRGFLVSETRTATVNNAATAIVTAHEYDFSGRKTRSVSPNNYTDGAALNTLDRTEFAYDAMDRLVTQTEIYKPYNINTMSFEANAVGNVVKAFKYDFNGNIVKELGGEGYAAGTGNTVSEKIESGYGKTFSYDLSNQKIMEAGAETLAGNLQYSMLFEYDGLGRTILERNAKGNQTKFIYNDADREVKSVTETRTADNSYDTIISYKKFDLLGNIIKSHSTTSKDGTVETANNEISYAYNVFGQIKQEIHPSDDSISANTINYLYNSVGLLAKKQDSTGASEAYAYNNRGLELSRTVSKGAESSTARARYDKNGNKRYAVDANTNASSYTTAYSYDGLNRLKSTTANGKTTSYGLDKNGNILTETNWAGNVSTNVYDKLNRLVTRKNQEGDIIEKLEYNLDNSQTASYTPYHTEIN
jgi:YD repeat-containing protein